MNKYSVYLVSSVAFLNSSFPWEEYVEGQGQVGSPWCSPRTFPLCLFGDFPRRLSCMLILEDQDRGILFQKVCEDRGLLCF